MARRENMINESDGLMGGDGEKERCTCAMVKSHYIKIKRKY